MKNRKMISLALLTLGVCSGALATDYKTPKVGFKAHSPAAKEMKPAEFGENYKVEGAVATDRQIASEEESDREPSSLKSKYAKKEVVKVEEPMVKEEVNHDVAPKPWLYRSDTNHQK